MNSLQNYINMKKEIETINKGQEEMKNTISELKNTVDGIKSMLDEAEDWISELEDKVEKNTQKEQEKEKRLRKNEEGLREMQDNMKCNNIQIRGILEGEEEIRTQINRANGGERSRLCNPGLQLREIKPQTSD